MSASAPFPATPLARLSREARLVAHAASYELRKATLFRTGFLVREVLRGTNRPLVMLFVYFAIVHGNGNPVLGGYTFPALVSYLVMVATFQKVLIHERAFELSQQIFEGTITKFLVMPLRYFTLILGRFVQYTLLQLTVAIAFYVVGLLCLPAHWPRPASAEAAAGALLLVLLGSYCYLLLFTIIHSMAFWLDVVWTLLVASRFIIDFVSGTLIPVSIMPTRVQGLFRWLFPYWTLSAPIEIFLGRLPASAFAKGLAVLLATTLLLETVRILVWRSGVRQYAGSGM